MMYGYTCHSGTLGSLGSSGGLDLIGLLLNLVLTVGLLAGLALLVVYAVRRARVPAGLAYTDGRSTSGGQKTTGQPDALKVLQARYARGEITREQYETLKNDIG